MGSVKKILSKTKLLEREKHHSRMFVDLAENIHIQRYSCTHLGVGIL